MTMSRHVSPNAFQSTLSMRRATRLSLLAVLPALFQSTLSMRRATDICVKHSYLAVISIHALHEESDRRYPPGIRRGSDFNPRSP